AEWPARAYGAADGEEGEREGGQQPPRWFHMNGLNPIIVSRRPSNGRTSEGRSQKAEAFKLQTSDFKLQTSEAVQLRRVAHEDPCPQRRVRRPDRQLVQQRAIVNLQPRRA